MKAARAAAKNLSNDTIELVGKKNPADVLLLPPSSAAAISHQRALELKRSELQRYAKLQSIIQTKSVDLGHAMQRVQDNAGSEELAKSFSDLSENYKKSMQNGRLPAQQRNALHLEYLSRLENLEQQSLAKLNGKKAESEALQADVNEIRQLYRQLPQLQNDVNATGQNVELLRKLGWGTRSAAQAWLAGYLEKEARDQLKQIGIGLSGAVVFTVPFMIPGWIKKAKAAKEAKAEKEAQKSTGAVSNIRAPFSQAAATSPAPPKPPPLNSSVNLN